MKPDNSTGGDGQPCPRRSAARGEFGVMFFWGGIWLFWMIQPFLEAVRTIDTAAGLLGAITVPVFCAVYLWHFYAGRATFMQTTRPRPTPPHHRSADLLRYALLGGLAVLCMVAVGQSGYAAAIFFALSAFWTFGPVTAWLMVLATGAAYVLSWQLGWKSDSGSLLGLGFAAAAITAGRMAGRRQHLLQESQRVNAELLVQQERNRMARDLHDILGHSLTVITVKAELAGRLLDADAAERARAEVADLERLSRTALADVRRAVEGYREISLAGELAAAREALAAAAIQARIPSALDEVPADMVEPFAWTVRESVTNVLRHSQATTCTIAITPSSVTVSDDGIGPRETQPGNGLRGLQERAAAAGAVLVTKALQPHGFSVTVAVPGSEAAVQRDEAAPSRTASEGISRV